MTKPKLYIITNRQGDRIGSIKAWSSRSALKGFRTHIPSSRHHEAVIARLAREGERA